MTEANNFRRRWLVLGSAIAVVALMGVICILFPRQITSIVTDYATSFRIKVIQIAGVALIISSAVLFAIRQLITTAFSDFGYRFAVDRQLLMQDIRNGLWAESRLTWLVLGIIFLIGIIVRVAYLSQPIRNDEAYTLFHFASLPIFRAITTYSEPNNHILNTMLIHFLLVFGNSEWIIRLPAFFAGLCAIPLGFVVGRQLYNTNAGLLTATLIATSSALVEFSTNARGYTLQIMFFLAALALAVYLTRRDNKIAWTLYALMWILGFYTLPTTLYPFGIVSLWLAISLFFRGKRPLRWHRVRNLVLYTALAGVLTLVLYAPVFFVSGIRPVINAYTIPLSWHDFFTQLPDFLTGLAAKWNRDLGLVIALTLGASLIVSQSFHRRLSRDYPLLPVAIGWCGGLLILQHTIPFLRVWLFLAPLYYLFAAAGLSYLLGLLASRFRQPVNDNPSRTSTVPLIMAFLLVIGVTIATSVLTSRSVYFSDETGTAVYSPQFAAFLTGKVASTVGVIDRWNVMLRYNMLRQGDNIDLVYLNNTIDPMAADSLKNKQKIYLVVPDQDTLARVTTPLQAISDWQNFSTPQPVLPLTNATVYLATRKSGALTQPNRVGG